MTEKEKRSNLGIAASVANRLIDWADEKRKLASQRADKFKERDGIMDQIREATEGSDENDPATQHELETLKAEAFDVIEEIKELDRSIKYLTTKIDATLCDPKIRSQEVTDPDILGTIKPPAPEPKKHKDDGQQMLASAGQPPSDGSESDDIMEIDEADSAKLADYNGVPNGEPATWMAKRWDEAPFGRKQKLDADIGGKWFATTDQLGEVAIKAKLATPKALLDEVTLAYLGGQPWPKDTLHIDVARVLVQEAARQHLHEPSAGFADCLAAFVTEGELDTLREISPLAAAIAEKDRDLKGEGDGTEGAPDGPQGGGSGQAKKRAESAKAKKPRKTKKAA